MLHVSLVFNHVGWLRQVSSHLPGRQHFAQVLGSQRLTYDRDGGE